MKVYVFTLLLVLICFMTSQSQVLKVEVKIEYMHLSQDDQDKLVDLKSKIEQYFNGYEWIEDEYEYDVNCNIQIIIETVQKKTFEKIYKTQFVISSESGENFYDKSWEFPYEPSASLNHTKGQFDPLTHFLDFYAFMILAGEMDTNGLFFGTPLYDKAMDIANQAMLSQYTKGWSQRIDELLKITHVRTRPLREVKPAFFEALYLYKNGKYNKAYQLARKVMQGIQKVVSVQPNNRYLSIFFNAHHRQLAVLFAGRNAELEKLTEFDSKHRETYRKQMR